MVSPPDRVVRLQCKGAMAIGKLPWAWQRQGGSLRSLLPTLGPFLQLPIGSRAHTHVYRSKGLVSGMINTSSTQDLPAAASKSRGIVTHPKKEWEMGRPPSHLLGQLRSPWASSPTLSGRYMSTRRPPVASEMRPPTAHSADTPADLISSPAAEGKFGSPSCQSSSLCATDFSHLPHLSHLTEPSCRSPSSMGSHISPLFALPSPMTASPSNQPCLDPRCCLLFCIYVSRKTLPHRQSAKRQRLQSVIQAARPSGLPAEKVGHGFRQDFYQICEENKVLNALPSSKVGVRFFSPCQLQNKVQKDDKPKELRMKIRISRGSFVKGSRG